MADDEQFSLCWNNFNSNLSAGFHESLCRGDLVDVTLAAEGQFVKAHRLVLSVCSPYFRRMFTQMPANQHAFVFLKDVSHSALKDLIQFMYCGEVNVKQDALPAFISTAEALQIKGLTDSEPAPSQSPAKPSTPAPQQTIPASTMTNVTTTSPRARSSNQRNRSSYKLESEDSGDENKPTNQLVLQSSQSHQQQQTLVQQQTQKRPAQRSITPQTVATVKRIKNSDPLEGTEPTQITVQTVSDNKSNSGEAEFIDLPIDLPTKSEPDYTEDAGDVETAEQEATYVEDDSYGDMKYDESYFTENDETATVPTTSAATVKQSASFSESYVSDTGDQATTEAQDIFPKIEATEFELNLPFETEDQFLITELRTRADSTIQNSLREAFDSISHSHLSEFLNQNLDKLMIDEVASRCSWYGNNQSIPVKGFVILQLLKESALKKFKDTSEKDVLRQLKKWFILAKDRKRKRIERISQQQRKKQPLRVTEQKKQAKPKKIDINLNLNFPFRNEDDFIQGEHRAQTDFRVEKYIREWFSKSEYDDLSQFIRGNLQDLITDKVAKKFSWFGKQGNIPVKGYLIMKLLKDVAAEKFQYATEIDIINYIKKWFQKANERIRQRWVANKKRRQNAPQHVTFTTGNGYYNLILPSETLEQFIEMEENAKTNERIEKYFVNMIKSNQQKELSKYIKEMLCKLLTDDVAIKFSWSGNYGKIAIKDYFIMKLIMNGAATKFDSVTYDELVHFIKKWFRLARDRLRKRKTAVNPHCNSMLSTTMLS